MHLIDQMSQVREVATVGDQGRAALPAAAMERLYCQLRSRVGGAFQQAAGPAPVEPARDGAPGR
eukprot:3602200-Lingulodinium_polyedra.AAC.1